MRGRRRPTWLGRSRFFRYEVRRWRGGVIPDVSEAVASPLPLSTNRVQAQQVLELVPAFPSVTWGRDELDAGEMWNSNSLISWLLVSGGMLSAPWLHLSAAVHRMVCRARCCVPGFQCEARNHRVAKRR